MDLQMPVMDGFAATKQIRASDKKIPIIALTANAMKEDLELTELLGMNAHLSKPIEVDAFYATLLQYLSKEVKTLKQEHIDKAPAEVIALPDFVHIDTEVGLRYLGGNVKAYKKVLQNFKTSYTEICLEKMDDETLHRMAHTIKGLSATIGASALSGIAEELEMHGDRTLLASFDNELAMILDDLTLLEDMSLVNREEKRGSLLEGAQRITLFDDLLEAARSKQVKRYTPIMTKIKAYDLSAEDTAFIEAIEVLMKKYRFKEIVSLIEKSKEHE